MGRMERHLAVVSDDTASHRVGHGLLEAVRDEFLEGEPDRPHKVLPPVFDKGVLDRGEDVLHNGEDVVVHQVRLRLGRATPVGIAQDPNDRV